MARKQKNKQRVAFRKNRGKRSRQGNLTRDVDIARTDEAEAARIEDLPTEERLSGKGELTRNRTIIVGDIDGTTGRSVREIDESIVQRGRVLSSAGLNSIVQAGNGRSFECTVRRIVRTLARETRNAVVAGDWVLFQQLDDQYGVIERVEPRHSTLSRGSRRHEHIIVSNIDQVVIVVSAVDPPLKPSLVDRFIISAAKGDTAAIVCVNKADLIDRAELQPILGLYASLGYQSVMTSAESGEGIETLRWLLVGRQTVFTGQSGVGKSSLLNRIQPNLALETGSVSSWSHKGKHTTRRAVLLPLDSGGWLVDTPGIRQLGLWDVIAEEVEGFFIEFHPFVAFCRFPNCSHTHEAGCRVKDAVESGLISHTRYVSYLRIISGQEEEEALK
ncbi:ribosome small subunit-dependent GTPase A [bacterium]|nr:ribosome small subunit-dependent GTPase A [bacterium]